MSLLEKFPQPLQNAPEFAKLQQALDPETVKLAQAAEDCMAQLCVSTATWGLDLWEQALGLPVDKHKDVEYRRTRLASKLRGSGVVTSDMVRDVAASFSNGEVAVSRVGEFEISIRFWDTIGIPPNMDDLTAALRDIMPAHLKWTYVYTYNTWDVLKAHTWGELKTRTWGQVKGEKF